MIRQHFTKPQKQKKDQITWRGHDVLRIEAFSDAVFGFTLSLLAVSVEVPHTAKELFIAMRGFYPFVVCFGFIFFVWYTQHQFFRQFGLNDTPTLLLNAGLLLLVLFYVYPLKFMTSVTTTLGRGIYTIESDDFIPLIALYNYGFTGIYLLFTLMYLHAYRQRAKLQLTPVEQFVTRTHLYMNLYITGVGLSTAMFGTFAGRYGAYSMGGYGLMGGLGILSSARDKIFIKKFGNVPETGPLRIDD